MSTWLASTNDPARVAEWAGHSIDVLLKIYAKVLDGQQDQALRRIQETLSASEPGTPQARRRPRQLRRRRP